MFWIAMFICNGCRVGDHGPCRDANKGRHTADCDCQHREKK